MSGNANGKNCSCDSSNLVSCLWICVVGCVVVLIASEDHGLCFEPDTSANAETVLTNCDFHDTSCCVIGSSRWCEVLVLARCTNVNSQCVSGYCSNWNRSACEWIDSCAWVCLLLLIEIEVASEGEGVRFNDDAFANCQ